MEQRGKGLCLVTGATGFLGTELLRQLRAAGTPPDRVRCLVRDRSAAAVRGIPERCMALGDVTDFASLRQAVAGVDVVFHLAATVKSARARGYFPVNRDGAEHLARAVAAAAPEAFVVHVSSLAAAGPSVDGQGSDRQAADCTPVSAYGESKRQGELAMSQLSSAWAIVRPPVVYGSGDAATRLLFAQACAPFCPVPLRARPLSIVHVREVARALLAVAQRKPHAAVLPLDGLERTTTHALLRTIAAVCGRRARLLPVPLGLAAAAASLCDLYASCCGRASFFNGDKVRELAAVGWVADGSRARSLLGFQPDIPLEPGLEEVARTEGSLRAAGTAP